MKGLSFDRREQLVWGTAFSLADVLTPVCGSAVPGTDVPCLTPSQEITLKGIDFKFRFAP